MHFTPITRIYPSIYLSIHPSIHPPIHLSVIYFQRDMKYHRDSKSQSYIRRHTQRSVVPSYYPVPISPLFPLHSYPHPPIVNNFISFWFNFPILLLHKWVDTHIFSFITFFLHKKSILQNSFILCFLPLTIYSRNHSCQLLSCFIDERQA